MPKKILQKESPILRKVSESVAIDEIKTSKISKILKELKVALDSQDDGVAIAAPQIGYNLRVFIVSRKAHRLTSKTKNVELDEEELEEDSKTRDLVFINPVIKKLSKDKKTIEEGCLSVRYLYGQVSRSNKATVVAYDENGNKFERGGTGLLAQIFQHEVDHLNGILFIDKAKFVEEIPPETLKRKNR